MLLLINHLPLKFYWYSLSANIIISISIPAKISTLFYLVVFLNKVYKLKEIELKILNECQELKL
jgi:hypothetical protein